MNELKVFEKSEFGELRVLEIDGKVYFPATACAKLLGYTNPHDAIKRHCKTEGVVKREGVSFTTNQHGKKTEQIVSTNYINEGNLYRLIVSSKLPSAERFEKWVFDEVLPTIRKTGSYSNTTDLSRVVEQIGNLTMVMVTVLDKVNQVIDKQLEFIRQQTEEMTAAEPIIKFSETPCSSRCKLETFPGEITGKVDEMLEDMLKQQALNFSMIARFCTINGYNISSPSVKTYFERHFNSI